MNKEKNTQKISSCHQWDRYEISRYRLVTLCDIKKIILIVEIESVVCSRVYESNDK